VGCVLEIGPGAALARMWNQRYPDVPARSADEFHSLSAVVRWIERSSVMA
jgi:[acyl-carrier-protein] S-malonyltransferase